jgi:hypothetical protein
MEFSMLLPNQTVKTRRHSMSAKSNTNLKAIELTQSELDSVTGGLTGNKHRMAARYRALKQKFRLLNGSSLRLLG